MARKAKSMRGETVDFDVLAIKQQIAKKKATEDIENRERFIYSKRRRKAKKVIDSAVQQSSAKPQSATKTAANKPVVKPRKKIIKKK